MTSTTGPVNCSTALLQLLDQHQAEVVARLVEQQLRAPGEQQREFETSQLAHGEAVHRNTWEKWLSCGK
ncbi:hypothetical protein ACWGH5_35715 [Streptomyces sp. NPDC054864]